MPKAFITGDTHMNIDISKLSSRHFPIGNMLTKDDVVIILGDAGLVWDGSSEEKYWRTWLNNKPWTTFCVLGNHECYPSIAKLPIVEKFGGKVRQVENSIFYAETGTIYNILGKRCMVVNGADSHDKEYRKEGVSWWPQEQISEADVERSLCAAAENTIDFLLTHTGGTEICRTLGFAPTISDKRLDRIMAAISVEDEFMHFCGHYHRNCQVNEYTKILYNDILLLHSTE